MQLIVAEKPSVARDLARVLGARPAGRGRYEGDGRVISYCVGHLVELDEPGSYDPRWKAWSLDTLPMLPTAFKLRPAKHGGDQLRELVSLLRDRRFDSVVNACDAGREGELIFRYVYEHAGCRLPVRRLWISSLTDEAIRRGFAGMRDGRELDALGDAARARSEADWLVGMNATRAVTVRHRGSGDSPLFSIGRVQTPTLAMLVAREQALLAFVPTPYWEVRATLAPVGGQRFVATWTHGAATRLGEAALADAVVARAGAHGRASDPVGPRVERVRARTVREAPPLLFDLTSLQRTANRRFGMSAQRTLDVAQALYERHKLLTYPRTDSRHLTADVARELPKLFTSLAAAPEYAPFASRLVARPPRPGRRIVDDAKVHDHHAIIPTGKPPRMDGLDRDEQRLFDLVVRRFLGAFYPDAEFAVTDVVIRVGAAGGEAARVRDTDEEADAPLLTALPPPPDRFVARGRVRRVAGWQEVAGIDGDVVEGERERGARRARGDGAPEAPLPPLPPLAEGQALDGSFESLARRTQPPRRYTEATLLSAMESAGRTLDDEELRAAMKDTGLGTPATRAAIIETLLKRGYVVRDKKTLLPTATGMALIRALPAGTLASPELTGTWEARLARVARGEETRARFMADIRDYVRATVDAIRRSTVGDLSRAASGAGSPRPDRRPELTERRPPKRSGSPKQRSGRRRSPPRNAAATDEPSRPKRRKQPLRRKQPGRSDRPKEWGGPPCPPSRTPAPARAPRPARRSVGELACPRCRAGRLVEGRRGWGCGRWREGCSFVVWFETEGRKLTVAQLRDLVVRGQTRRTSWSPAGAVIPVAGRLVLDVHAPGGARLERD